MKPPLAVQRAKVKVVLQAIQLILLRTILMFEKPTQPLEIKCDDGGLAPCSQNEDRSGACVCHPSTM